MPGNDIIKRRLKSLRQQADDKAKAKADLAAGLVRRADANGISVDLQKLVDRPNAYAAVCRPMPLSFYYGAGSSAERDEAFQRRRTIFYSLCARVFSFHDWDFQTYAREIYLAEQIAGGRDGRPLSLLPMDQDQAVNLNTNAAPLEFLVSQSWLETKSDPAGYGHVRWATALRFRDVVAGAQSGGLKAQAYEGSGSGFGPKLVSDYALDCMRIVKDIEDRLHPGLYRVMRMVVVDDIWLWEVDARRAGAVAGAAKGAQTRQQRVFREAKRRRRSARRDRIILKLHKAIDGAAVVFNYISQAEYEERW